MTALFLLASIGLNAQTYDAGWLDPSQEYVKLAVVSDGIHAVSGQMLSDAGVNLASVDVSALRLVENGVDVPLLYQGGPTLDPGDEIIWVGHRNDGTDEDWAYGHDPSNRSSSYYSIYTDTTYYWLSWGGAPGPVYVADSPGASPAAVTSRPFVAHQETESTYFKGDSDADTSNPIYTRGEGYYWHTFSHRNQTDVLTFTSLVGLPGVITDEGHPASIESRVNFASASGHSVVLEVELDQGAGPVWVPIDTAVWSGYGFGTLSGDFSQDEIPAGSGQVNVRVSSHNGTDINPTGIPNQVMLDYIEIEATTRIVAPDGHTRVATEVGGPVEIDVSEVSVDSEVLGLNPVGQTYAVVPMGGAAYEGTLAAPASVYLAKTSAYQSPVRVVRKSAATVPDLAGSFAGAQYLILSTPVLEASAQQLASYRSSPEGGGYSVAVLDIYDVFDVFDYGRTSPIAVQHMMMQSMSWPAPPEFLMLWGDTRYSFRERPMEPWQVLSFGRSSSDGWFSMQFDGQADWSEEVATGRLPIRDNAAGESFIQKLTSYESRPPADWTKHALIIAGGANESQQSTLQYYSNQWSDIVRAAPFGGRVTNYYKSSDSVLDPTFRDSIEHSIRSGASWLGYFGHSSTTRWEIIVNPPEEFDNADVLPVALSLGCYNGAFGEDTQIFAEDVILKSPNGAIAHWGGTASSFIGQAANIATPVYEQVFEQNKRILGKAITEAKRSFVALGGELNIATNLQYNLVGDPATRLTFSDKPDLYVKTSQIAVEPFAPNPADDSLTVTVRVRNMGIVPDDSVEVQLTHWTPDARSFVYTTEIPPVYIEESVQFRVDIDESMIGDNRLRVVVDPSNVYDEANELNNTEERTQVVFATGLTLLYPPDYGLVPTTQPDLRVSLSSQDASGLPVIFQLDTVSTFDSPFLKTGEKTAPLTVDWTPPLPLDDGELYYWRARIDDPSQQASDWKTASFSIRGDLGADGWYQQEEQLNDNATGGYIERLAGEWTFKEFDMELRIDQGRFMYVGPNAIVGLTEGYPTILVDGNSGNVKDVALVQYTEEEDIAELEALLASAATGDIVMARSRTFANIWDWFIDEEATQRVKDAFMHYVGATEIAAQTKKQHWAMIAKMGGEVHEWVTERSEEGTQRIVAYDFSFSGGIVQSSRIGPSQSWNTVGWDAALDNDESHLEVEVRADDGTVLQSGMLLYPDGHAEIDISGVDAALHPYLSLSAALVDSSHAKSPQLLDWYVTYEPIPELIMDPAALTLSADTVSEGQDIEVAATVINYGRTDATSVLVRYTVTDEDNHSHLVGVDTLETLPAQERATSSRTFNTRGLAGRNRLEVAASLDSGLQEAVTYNNIGLASFVVRADKEAPAFAVLIDGAEYPDDPRQITSTDDPTLPFVTARPTIEIVVNDDSRYLPMTDTSNFHVSLDGAELSLDRPDIRFEPGTLENNNEARIIFTPDFTDRDTTHTLTFWAKDASGNANPTELSPYQVHFRIQNAADVESLYPYPNPMTNFTRFAFQLRGADPGLVEDFRIRIYTLSGQLVQEFDLIDDPALLESGMLRIGWNKLVWDTRDADGHDLGSGVYLYKVFLRADGEEITVNNDTGIDKLVIMR